MSSESVAFDAKASEVWRGVLGGVRDIIRQELVARQLARHLTEGTLQVLDVGCGQGSQAIQLARAGHEVTGVDPAPEMLELFETAWGEEDPQVQKRIEIIKGYGEEVADRFAPRAFDVVLCHGVIAYLRDPDVMLNALSTVLRPRGLLSLLTVNGDALAMQPGLSGNWAEALAAFDEKDHVTRLGVPLRAMNRANLLALLSKHSLKEKEWYGLRVFTDRSADVQPDDDLTELLKVEERAGCSDPYRAVAAFIHTIAVPQA